MSLWVRYLQTEAAVDPWKVFKYVTIGLSLLLVCCALFREYLYYSWDIDCCRRGTRNSSEQEHQPVDQRHSLVLLAEEMAQHNMDARRQERRQKYEQFLAPYTIVSQKSVARING